MLEAEKERRNEIGRLDSKLTAIEEQSARSATDSAEVKATLAAILARLGG